MMTTHIVVTRELYTESDHESRPNRMAFSIRFPDGTGCWSHNTTNVAARISEYRALHRHPVDVSWLITDVPCPVRVAGELDPVEAIARWVERGQDCAALERIRVGPRNAIARKIRQLFAPNRP